MHNRQELGYAHFMDHKMSVKNYTTTLLLAIFVGFFGAHRFYAGKVFTGLLFLFTFGFLGIGWLIDIITVAVGNFTDKTGLFIRPKKTTPTPEGNTVAQAPDNQPSSPQPGDGINQPATTPVAPETAVGSASDSPKRKVPTWLWVVGGILVFGLVLSAFNGDDDADTQAENPTDTPVTVEEDTSEPAATEAQEEVVEEEPEPEPPALFEPVVLEGSGDDVIDVPVITDSIIVATFTHQGSSNFSIVSYNESGERISLLVNEIGSYQGTVPFNFSEAPAELEISANGAWTVTLSDLLEQPVYDGSLLTGSGDEVLLVTTDSSRLAAAHSGSSNFVITGWGDRRDLLVNEIGSYDGTVRLGNALALEVVADGEWTLTSE